YRAGSWRLFGTAEVVVVDLVAIDDVRWSVDSCEYDLAAYPVDESGNAAVPTEDRWIPEAHYFTDVDGEWKLDARYRARHDCGWLE
nr:hypothetical protein [Micromonospora sp. DSM 115978]